MLVEQSRIDLRRKSQQHKTYSFIANNEEVIPIFDPPHLLKAIRNNMLIGHVHYKWQNKHYEVAKWEHIIKLYELDGDMEDFIDDNDFNTSDLQNVKLPNRLPCVSKLDKKNES